MALRVLLGDESSTIKKVFQLSLQDFAVEVRPVNIGVDVATVALGFNPDIIFVDVLLQKKNGYEVALELKQNPKLKDIPVVLMWSGFMELDEDKFSACFANAQLEKPFDVAALRKLVTDLVPRTSGQRLSQFLSFPQMPEIKDSAQAATPPVPDEDFQHIPLPKMKTPRNEKFQLNLKPEELDPSHLPVDYEVPNEKSIPEDLFKNLDEEEEFAFRESVTSLKSNKPILEADLEMAADGDDRIVLSPETQIGIQIPTSLPVSPAALSEDQLEKIIRAQSAEMIETVIWKVVPELAKQIIERELNRLLKERDSHP